MSYSFIISLFLSILLTLGTKLNLTSPLTSFLSTLTNPFLSPLTHLRTVEVRLFDFLKLLPTTASENNKLVQENNSLKVRVKELTEAIANQALVIALDQLTWQVQPVRLVSLGSTALFTSHDLVQIRPGQPVVSGKSLIGLVKSVQPPIVKVLPLNHPDVKVAAQLETGTKGDYLYKNSLPYIINLPTNIAFNSKTIVLTLPSENIPENLIIGQIERITTNPANPTQEATLTLDQDIGSARDFFIITQP